MIAASASIYRITWNKELSHKLAMRDAAAFVSLSPPDTIHVGIGRVGIGVIGCRVDVVLSSRATGL
jgi:hypothetical protein